MSKMPSGYKSFEDNELIALLRQGKTNVECGRILEVSESAIRKRIKKLRSKGFDIHYSGWDTAVPDGFKSIGRTIQRDSKGAVIQQWEKSSIDKERQLEIIKGMTESLVKDLPKYNPQELIKKDIIDEDLLVVLPIGDLHVGMLSWVDETGVNWDLKRCQIAVYHAFSKIIEACPNAKKCLIINCGDFFHRDNMPGVTAKSGHILDTDSRYPKMVDVGVTLIRMIISFALAKFPEVDVINSSGNHDQCTTAMLSIALKHVYEKEYRVHIHEKACPIHYLQWGKVMIAATHGDTIKMDKLPGIVAQDQAKMWGETEFRYGITGHIHCSKRLETPGMLIESFRTLAAADSYAAWYGWRSGRDTQAIIYHKEHGELYRHIVGISMIKEFLEDK